MNEHVNPYQTPQTQSHDPVQVVGDYPGIKRLPYFLLVLGISFGLAFLMGIVGAIIGSNETFGVMYWTTQVVVMGVSIFLGVRRLQNIGTSGWWILLSIVPLVNMIVGIALLALPTGYADHRQMDTAGKVVIGIMIGLFVLSIVAFIGMFAILAGQG